LHDAVRGHIGEEGDDIQQARYRLHGCH
jgi:hypothetical protein